MIKYIKKNVYLEEDKKGSFTQSYSPYDGYNALERIRRDEIIEEIAEKIIEQGKTLIVFNLKEENKELRVGDIVETIEAYNKHCGYYKMGRIIKICKDEINYERENYIATLDTGEIISTYWLRKVTK